MKKKFVLALLLCSFLVVGCGKTSEKKINEKMEEYAKDYYATYVKDFQEGATNQVVSLSALKELVENGTSDYDLSIFKNCKDESYADLALSEDGEITSIELHMNCK